MLCRYFFFDVLLFTSSCSSFLSQVEVPLPMIGGALAQETVVAQPTTASGVEKEPSSGGVAEEIK